MGIRGSATTSRGAVHRHRLVRAATVACAAALGVAAVTATAPATALATSAGNVAINAGHDRVQGDGLSQPPLTQRWSQDDLYRIVGQPVIAAGRVFVARYELGSFQRLQAYDLATGRLLWERAAAMLLDGGVAANADTVVATGRDGTQAFDVTNGATRWIASGTSRVEAYRVPVVDGDTLFTVEQLFGSEPGGLVARSMDDGHVLWSRASATADAAVDGDRVVTTDGCDPVALDRVDGHVLWGPVDTGDATCSAAPHVAVHAGRVVAKGAFGVRVLDLGDGGELGRPDFGAPPLHYSDPQPALIGDLAIVSDRGGVTARELPGGGVRWHNDTVLPRGDPMVSGDSVFVPTGGGVAALDRTTGVTTWSATATPTSGEGTSPPVVVLAADGVLLQADDHGFVAWAAGDLEAGHDPLGAGGPDSEPARPGDEAANMGQTPARDGFLGGDDPAAPLERRWRRDLGGDLLSSPVTQGDTAFVVMDVPTSTQRLVVQAMDLRTGVTRWRRSLPGTHATGARLAAGDGVVVVRADPGLIEAFDAGDGHTLWRKLGATESGASVLVDDGRVLTALPAPHRSIVAYDLRSGELDWQREVNVLSPVWLSSDGQRVYAGGGCGFVASVAESDGAPLWSSSSHAPFACSISSEREYAPIVHGDLLLTAEDAVRRSSDGVIVDRQRGVGHTAVSGRLRIGVSDGRVFETDARGLLQWTTPFSGTNFDLYTDELLIVGATAFVAKTEGGVVAIDVATGARLWSDDALIGVPYLAARPGTLLAGNYRQLVAYERAQAGPAIRLANVVSPTQSRRPALTWDTDGATLVTCSVDGAAALPCASGFAPAADLAEGDHRLTVHATGDDGTTSSSAVVRVDVTPPDTTITSGPSGHEGPTPSALHFVVDEPDVSVECRLDGVKLVLPGDCGETTQLPRVPNGPHTLTVRATDIAGNVEPDPASISWTADAAGPHMAFTSAPAARSTDASPQIAFTSDDPGATFTCALTLVDVGEGLAQPCTSPQQAGPLPDGRYRWRVHARDAFGNEDSATTLFEIDRVAPQARIDSGPADLTNAASGELSFVALGAAEGFECRLDGGDWAACSSPRGVSTPTDGEHRFAVRAVDDLGNRGEPEERAWTVDRTPPVLTITERPAAYDAHSEAVFELHTSEPAMVICQLDYGQARTSCERFPALADGQHVMRWQLEDPAGNIGVAPDEYRWIVDTRAPAGAPGGGSAAPPSGQGAATKGAVAAPLSRAAIARLVADARTAVRRIARRGRGLAHMRSATITSTVPLAGRVTASLRLRGHAIATGHATLGRGGALRVRVAVTAAARRGTLRRPAGRLELRLSFLPRAGVASNVAAAATVSRR